jgi:uncharacterized membrane protein YgaE (UPF0421/DUF939 family)
MNLIMPSLDKNLKAYKKNIEDSFTKIFICFSEKCDDLQHPLDIHFSEIQLTIEKAKSLAFRDVKNHFGRNENSYYHYFDMREQQLDLIHRIEIMLANVEFKDELLTKLAQLFKEVAENVNSNDYTALRLHSLYEIRLQLDNLELPDTYASLKTRASLIQLLNELESYLQIKSDFGSLKTYSEAAS